METVSLCRKPAAKSHVSSGRGPWREGEAPAEPSLLLRKNVCISLHCGPGFKGSAGASPWDGETARTLQIVAFRSVETDTQLFHC
jgi:hypothetical protein